MRITTYHVPRVVPLTRHARLFFFSLVHVQDAKAEHVAYTEAQARAHAEALERHLSSLQRASSNMVTASRARDEDAARARDVEGTARRKYQKRISALSSGQEERVAELHTQVSLPLLLLRALVVDAGALLEDAAALLAVIVAIKSPGS